MGIIFDTKRTKRLTFFIFIYSFLRCLEGVALEGVDDFRRDCGSPQMEETRVRQAAGPGAAEQISFYTTTDFTKGFGGPPRDAGSSNSGK